MKSIFVILSFVLALAGITTAHAEEKTCAVKGMHCEACADMVKDKVCSDQYEVCDLTPPPEESAKAKGKKKDKLGQLHLKTKDAAVKIDEKALNTALADTVYKVECKAGQKAL